MMCFLNFSDIDVELTDLHGLEVSKHNILKMVIERLMYIPYGIESLINKEKFCDN